MLIILPISFLSGWPGVGGCIYSSQKYSVGEFLSAVIVKSPWAKSAQSPWSILQLSCQDGMGFLDTAFLLKQ